MTEIRNDHLPSAPERPDKLLREFFGTGSNEDWWSTVELGMDRSEMDIRERDCFFVWSVTSFAGVGT